MAINTISPIIQAEELLRLHGQKELLLIDVRTGNDAKSNYTKRHLDGALFIDLNTQLADIKTDVSDGGRHPLPDINQFAKTLAQSGITAESHIVIYDDKNGSNAAARCWWMLKSAGHKKLQVLNGGFQSAEKIGYPINANEVIPKPAETYNVSHWQLPLASINEVERVAMDPDFLVVDVRDASRYNGEHEPIDLIAGHIPGAINVPFTENLDAQGLFLSPHELKLKYENLFKNKGPENSIVHCGSGVTACHTLLAIAYANLEIPKLYVGSWSEWSRKMMS